MSQTEEAKGKKKKSSGIRSFSFSSEVGYFRGKSVNIY